ncbi:hypothetical protein C5167_046552 [Papaver somniferum]|uniref:Dof zinc finger protein n=1 Tax=Papaver somniferum TaxID=3469 RepID=A0A4Y7LEV4_PAPSO|nr:dof zinc finger protein DOF5.3-like [Papaver somniferum]RZC83766.1 hypothetical protein C5167_046552 [Papaver somniferum]
MDPSNLQQHQHQQGMATHTPTFEDVLNCPSAKELQEQQKRSLMNRPQPEALKCPRCDSSNTKFCYYNNYSLTQPRYFCKACRRYWTKGGSLRNVPVGGGCRKNNKRISSCSSSSATSKAKSSPSSSISSHHHLHHHHQDNNNNQIYLNTNSIINPLLTFPSSLSYDTNDLTLAFGRLHKQQPTTTRQLGFDHEHHQTSYGNTNSIIGNLINSSSNSSNTANPGFIDALRSGFLDPSSGFHNFYSSYGNGISMGDHHQQHHQQQQVESNNNNNNNNGGSVINGICHEEDDDQHHRDEQVVLPNYDQVEMGLTSTTSSTITTATKQELLKDNETKILWNFPWHGQFGGEQANHHHHHNNNSIHNNIMGNVIDTSSGVRDWNGLNGWHGLVNSPLM